MEMLRHHSKLNDFVINLDGVEIVTLFYSRLSSAVLTNQ